MATPPSTRPGPPADHLEGRLLAERYRLHRPIASGGMARVWEATDEVLTRRVAVKVLHPHLAADESFVRRFRAEAIAAARLTHPSIVSVYDTLSTDDGVNAIVMELVVGTTMRADLDQHGPMRLPSVLAIGTQVADALGAAHASGLVHRDVKPANILLSADGRVLVADFGIAKAAVGADLTSDGSMVGTAKYLAPEQVEGRPVDGRADLYALGVVLYEALTGVPPFVAETDAATALARLHRAPRPPRQLRADLPVAVEEVVLRAMALRPEDRYPDAASMRAALLAAGADPRQAPAAAQAAVAAAEPPLAPSPSVPPRPPVAPAPASAPVIVEEPARRRRRWPWTVAAILVIGAGVATIAGSVGGRTDPPGPLVTISTVDDFDPGPASGGAGDDAEVPELLPNLLDGDPATVWRTERYGDADVAARKQGVGVVAAIASPTALGRLDLVTPRGGWSAQVYVTTGDRPSTLAGWGDPVATVTDAPTGEVRVSLGGRTGQRVLVWFTRLAPTDESGRYAVQLASIALHAT